METKVWPSRCIFLINYFPACKHTR